MKHRNRFTFNKKIRRRKLRTIGNRRRKERCYTKRKNILNRMSRTNRNGEGTGEKGE
jgi:hypothetical protein